MQQNDVLYVEPDILKKKNSWSLQCVVERPYGRSTTDKLGSLQPGRLG
jgi:hypothetical protein